MPITLTSVIIDAADIGKESSFCAEVLLRRAVPWTPAEIRRSEVARVLGV
ncbi:MAG TPA: hypothetical protein VFV01_08000 [Spirillospora sp.]|nr:hypothetical protein [Spirillospora sp.]